MAQAKHALKFYFSNRYCYAHLQNIVNGKVRSEHKNSSFFALVSL